MGATPKPGLLVVTHGRFADELVGAAATILGGSDGLAAMSIGWNDDTARVEKQLRGEIERLDSGGGVLVLTDMFGGTPTNMVLALHRPGRVEIVTGVNLPMLIKFANLEPGVSLERAAETLAEQGRQAIQVPGRLLEATESDA